MNIMHSQRSFVLLIFILLGYECAAVASNPDGKTADLVTQTVYGFLDFTTTIGKTIMIFSPQSAPSLDISAVPSKFVDIIQTKPYSHQEKSSEIYPTKLSTSSKKSTIQNTGLARKDYLNQPDYDLLSRQPETYAEESYHVVDLISRKKSGSKRTNGVKDHHPVGLVTKLSGKVAMDGTTTIHETSVIGTYISGKYAQVLQSNFHVLNNSHTALSPTSTVRVLRTDSPSSLSIRQLGRFKTRPSQDEHRIVSSVVESSVHNNIRKHASGGKHKAKGHQKNKSSKVLRSSRRETDYGSSSSASHDSRRYSFRQKLQAVASPNVSSTNIKLRPVSVGRWQYKSSVKPRVYIRKASDFTSAITPTHALVTTNDIKTNTVSTPVTEVISQISHTKVERFLNNTVIEDQTAPITLYPIETINIDIVTPSNFEDVYYEIATIKTPYTFQMGGIKKTRYVTVTSTTEKNLDSDYLDKSTIKGPLIENILAPTTHINQLLQASSITTLSPCTLGEATATPSLDEYIETYTQSHIKLKTQVFPIVAANQSTSYLTLLQTYGVTSVITATKTTPVCMGNNLYEFNSKLDESGSELHLDLEFGDVANIEQDGANSSGVIEASTVSTVSNEVTAKKPTSNDEQIPNYYPTFSPEQLQQLAYLKLFQQNAQVPQLVTPAQEALPVEPLYESHIIPIINGKHTSYRTLSKLIARTEYPTEISTPQPQPQPQPLASLNPFVLQQPQFKLVTTAAIRPTILTQTLSRILKLTFGAKTALTTIYSTNVVSTDISTFITQSLPVQPTASFASFFPPAFPQFPFIG